MSDLYSQLKPAWHMDRIASIRAGLMPAPVHVQLVLSDLCNQDCSFCAYRMSGGLSTELFAMDGEKNPPRRIPTDKALEILDDCARMGVQAIQFTGGGEPTVHKDHLMLFARAQELGMHTALVTNGIRVDPAHPAIQAMQWIRVSVDAGTEETYSTVRRVATSHWRKAWESVAALASNCRGVVSVGFVVTPDNWHEVGLAAGLAKAAGARNLRVGAVFSEAGVGYYRHLRPHIREAIDAAKEEHDSDGFQIVDVFDRRMEDLMSGSPKDDLCGYQYLTAYIGGDLGLYRCCNTAYTRAGKVADLTNQRLRDVYLDGDAPRQQQPFDARNCRFCQFNGQNAVIGAMAKEPAHAAFV